MIRSLVICIGILCSAGGASAGQVTVAVAANFLTTARALADRFEADSGDEVHIVTGSTGTLFAQISHGAPYDVFLSADRRRPELLVAQGKAAEVVDYARGLLAEVALVGRFSEAPDLADSSLRIAVANPDSAPYGVAAAAVLRAVRGEAGWRTNVVLGESVGQAMSFVLTGNVDLGLVALSQAEANADAVDFWPLPQAEFPPIRQGAVLLSRAAANEAAVRFMAFLSSPQAIAIIRQAGYEAPQ